MVEQRRQTNARAAPQHKCSALGLPRTGEETVDELELLLPVEQH